MNVSRSSANAVAAWSDRVLGWIGNTALFAMMLFTFADVLGRYAFNSPIAGGVEFTEFLMVVLIFAALPRVTRAGEHVQFDLLDRFLAGGARRFQRVIGEAVCVAFAAALGWMLFVRAGRMSEIADSTQILRVPLYPFAYLMAVLVAIDGVAHAGKLVAALRGTPEAADASAAN